MEIQQRAIEYFALSQKGAAYMDILAEMPKFPEREVCFNIFDDLEMDLKDLLYLHFDFSRDFSINSREYIKKH